MSMKIVSNLKTWLFAPAQASEFSNRKTSLLTTIVAVLLTTSVLAAAAAMPSPVGAVTDEKAADGGVKTGNSLAARLSSVEGQVQVVMDGQVIADPATANLPLFEGTQILAGNDGKAEIQLEDGSLARLSPNSVLTLTVLKREGAGTKTEMVLNSGLGYFELQPSNAEHNVRVSYGTASFVASSFTVARLTLDNAPGELAVLSGNVHLESGESLQVDVHGGESLTLNGNERSGYDLAETIEPNSWDSWNADRDQLLNSESASKTAASGAINMNQTPGMSDLDANGNWYNVPGQGYVWSPYEAQSAGDSWDPYGYGSWVNYPGYGYVFTSGYGWGYAPYQCGAWNYFNDFGWGWAPGAGGCNPWYGGYGGWGFNLGNYPRGYKPPRRPAPYPVHPRPGGGGTGGHLLKISAPTVPVDRRAPGLTSVAPNPHPGQPVTIAGHVVSPLAPVNPRAAYSQSATSFLNNGTARPGETYYPGGAHPGYYPTTGGRPSSGAAQPTYRPSQAQGSRPAPSYSGNSGGGHVAAPSGGGMSGGGGGHAGGGGASAGGGGSHK